jgi:hypothetical protein
MRLAYCTHSIPKSGNSQDEYEDAFFPRGRIPRAREGTVSLSENRRRFAIADGASESLLAGRWADRLARAYARKPFGSREEPLATFRRATAGWPKLLDSYRAQRDAALHAVQWYEEPGLQRGAFATFLGLQLDHDGRHRRWEAVALGDSCVLHVPRNGSPKTFPMAPGDAFDVTPQLVCSRDDPARAACFASRMSGTFACEDQFVLMTDAVAAWCLAALDARSDEWQQLLEFDPYTTEQFKHWVEVMRKSGQMRNDDVTVMRVTVEE